MSPRSRWTSGRRSSSRSTSSAERGSKTSTMESNLIRSRLRDIAPTDPPSECPHAIHRRYTWLHPLMQVRILHHFVSARYCANTSPHSEDLPTPKRLDLQARTRSKPTDEQVSNGGFTEVNRILKHSLSART